MYGINLFNEISLVYSNGFENARNSLRRGRWGLDKCSELAQKRGEESKMAENAQMINERALRAF